MNINGEDVTKKLYNAIDPNHPYTMDDFDAEFNSVNPPTTAISSPDDFKIPVKFVNKSNNPNPDYAHDGDSGFDIRANLETQIVITPGERRLIPTGLYFELPPQMELQIRSRSGLALKNGIVVLNSPGTVDNSYRGEIGVILINHGDEEFLIKHGDRIAQGVFAYVSAKNLIKLEEVKKISDDTDRGSAGYGSSGIK